MDSKINHLAIIMDGNARWAKAQNLPTSEGHSTGTKAVERIISATMEQKIPFLSLYTFSSENWNRPQKEVAFLIKLFNSYLMEKINALNEKGVKLKIIGRFERLEASIQKNILDAMNITKNNDKLTLYICLGYGGRLEILDACQKIIDSGIKNIDEKAFRNYLYDPNMPDVDLFIRTGGIYRISNFLLWQIAYAELFFSKTYWPNFDKEDLMEAIKDYSSRNRNFGGRNNAE